MQNEEQRQRDTANSSRSSIHSNNPPLKETSLWWYFPLWFFFKPAGSSAAASISSSSQQTTNNPGSMKSNKRSTSSSSRKTPSSHRTSMVVPCDVSVISVPPTPPPEPTSLDLTPPPKPPLALPSPPPPRKYNLRRKKPRGESETAILLIPPFSPTYCKPNEFPYSNFYLKLPNGRWMLRIYFYGGDTAVGTSADSPQWISDLAILPINVPYALTRIPWQSSSGPQKALGGPAVYSHVGFSDGGTKMILVGGVTPDNNLTDEAPMAYTYDCALGRWNSFTLPHANYLNRQGASATVVRKGQAYIWGGKRARHQKYNDSIVAQLPSAMYRLNALQPSNSSTIVSPPPEPPLRYSHTQTLVNGQLIVILGGFDGLTGDAVSLADIWTFDTLSHQWNQVAATLDKESKPANRSSHSEVLMSDGTSILIYGGYDGYHVFNDVAVLDTKTWTWTVKNTNAAVQGRADVTTLIGNNMIVAFGFTGVSTSLTVMSDVEVLDITTWSWTSYYVPSPGYPGNGDTHSISGGGNQYALPSTPSLAIVAGAVTGGLVVFVLIIVALYIFNFQQKQQRQSPPAAGTIHEDDSTILPTTWDPFAPITPSTATPPVSPVSSAPTPLTINPHQQQRKRTNSLLPSPWKDYQPSHWAIKRASTTTGVSPQMVSLSKPDEPGGAENTAIIRRAVTTPPHIYTTPQIKPNGTVSGEKQQQEDEKHLENVITADSDDDDGFDRQEFILHSGEISSDQTTMGPLEDEHTPL